MGTTRRRQPKGAPIGGQFAAEHRHEADVRLHAPADPSTEVTVPDPDDPFAMPIYEGRAADAASRLRPGTYPAFDLHEEDAQGPLPYLLEVPDPGQIEWTGALENGGSRTATLDGRVISTTMRYPQDDPDDLTLPRTVTVDRQPMGEVYFSFDHAGWRALARNGDDSVHDTEDGAVRAVAGTATNSGR